MAISIDPVLRFFFEGSAHPRWHEPLRRIYDCEVVFVSTGRCVLVLDETRHILKAGSLAIIPPAFWHESWNPYAVPCRRHCLHFDWDREYHKLQAPLMTYHGDPFFTDRVHHVPPEMTGHLPLVWHKKQSASVIKILNLVLENCRSGDPLSGYLLWPFLQQLLDNLQVKKNLSADSDAFGKARRSVFFLKNFIDTNYMNPIGTADFHDTSGLSPSYLCQAFKKIIGRAPHAYLLDVRLQHARRLLKNSAVNIREAAEQAGFSDANYFSRLFRRRFEQSPLDFLKEQGGGGEIPPTVPRVVPRPANIRQRNFQAKP
ncbi:MAG: AraC family transcriptional regulator [Spirochaetota bacterium]